MGECSRMVVPGPPSQPSYCVTNQPVFLSTQHSASITSSPLQTSGLPFQLCLLTGPEHSCSKWVARYLFGLVGRYKLPPPATTSASGLSFRSCRSPVFSSLESGYQVHPNGAEVWEGGGSGWGDPQIWGELGLHSQPLFPRRKSQ